MKVERLISILNFWVSVESRGATELSSWKGAESRSVETFW